MKVKKFSKRTICLMCIVMTLAVLIGVLTICIQMFDNSAIHSTDITTQYIQEKVTESMSKYKYALQSLDIQDTVANEGTTSYKYMSSASTTDSFRTYLYKSSTGTELYQTWEYDDSLQKYHIYVCDTTLDVWVETFNETEPMVGTPWDMFSNLENYTLLDETDYWYDSTYECYVLEYINQSEAGVLYEEVFIRKEDFLPMGIMVYNVSDIDEDNLIDAGELDIDNENVEHADVSVPTYSECIKLYEVTFSNDDLKLFEKPDTYLSEEEYLTLIEYKESE